MNGLVRGQASHLQRVACAWRVAVSPTVARARSCAAGRCQLHTSAAAAVSATSPASSTPDVPILDFGPWLRQAGRSGTRVAGGNGATSLDTVLADPEPPAALVEAVAEACTQWGFFQVVNHGVDASLVADFDAASRAFFALPQSSKDMLRRSAANARGYFDDELTKQRRDWKEALDFGVTPARDWGLLPDDHPAHTNLDGFNRLPGDDRLPGFRSAMVAYYDALTLLSGRISRVMVKGLGVDGDAFLRELMHSHTSYLRLNYYPPCPPDQAAATAARAGGTPPLGISPHKDAGFLTVLRQDPDCHSLQVRRRDDPEAGDGTAGAADEESRWITVHPEADSFTINTGDMAQIWSNDRYHAPEHRVLSHPSSERHSAPYFFNPGFDMAIKPAGAELGTPRYVPCVWGYFRAQRFAGDFADWGEEVQISDFRCREAGDDDWSASWHVANQERFLAQTDFAKPFDLEAHRHLLTPPQE